MTDTTDPDQMTDSGRLGEVADILAAGVLRMRPRREKEREFSPDNCLAAPIASSPHATGP